MDVSTAMRCLPSHLRVCEPWGLLLPTLGLVLGTMARWEAPIYWFTGKYFGSLYSLRQLHMMKLLMANSLSCSMQQWRSEENVGLLDGCARDGREEGGEG